MSKRKQEEGEAGAWRELPAEPDRAEPAAERPAPAPRQLTADKHFVASKDPRVAAFLHCERLAPRARKLSAAEWDQAFQDFAAAPR